MYEKMSFAKWRPLSLVQSVLTHSGRDNVAIILQTMFSDSKVSAILYSYNKQIVTASLQTTSSNLFSCMAIVGFLFKFNSRWNEFDYFADVIFKYIFWHRIVVAFIQIHLFIFLNAEINNTLALV